ncbi:class I SAM-dependent methyltransferase [Desulfobacterales bacterium HSG2]|nr:class I SAM-dependent methyltransferase [Desulfobacterales bacterium HSG2]
MDFSLMTSGIKEYMKAEERFIIERIAGSESVLDIGCGAGRYLQLLAPHVQKIVGIDYAEQMVAMAESVVADLPNVSVINCSAEEITTHVNGTFEVALLAWNTIGNIQQKSHSLVFQNLAQMVGKHIFISSYRLGKEVLEERLKYYKNVGMKIEKIIGDHVIFEGDHIGAAYPRNYFRTLISEAGFQPFIHEISSCGLIVEGRKLET